MVINLCECAHEIVEVAHEVTSDIGRYTNTNLEHDMSKSTAAALVYPAEKATSVNSDKWVTNPPHHRSQAQ